MMIVIGMYVWVKCAGKANAGRRRKYGGRALQREVTCKCKELPSLPPASSLVPSIQWKVLFSAIDPSDLKQDQHKKKNLGRFFSTRGGQRSTSLQQGMTGHHHRPIRFRPL